MGKKEKAGKGRVVWGLLIVGVLVAGLFFSTMEEKLAVRTATVKKGTIRAYVEERGRTSLPHIYHVTMPMQGRVLPIVVQEGDPVEKGEVLVYLDDADWRDAEKETLEIISATAKWVEAVEAQVKAGIIRRDYNRWEWQSDEKLLQAQSISEQDERESRRRYLDSEVKVEESQAMLHMSRSISSIMDLLPGYVERNLDRTTVESPVSGTVLKRHVWNEKVMTAGEPLLDIGDMADLEVTADILTEAAVALAPGDRVEVYGDVIGDDILPGRVRLIEPEAFTKISSLGVEEQRVAVKIAFDEGVGGQLKKAGKRLGLEYRVRVRIITDENKDVILVPRTALFRGSKGQWQLYRVEGGKARLTDVRLGLSNDFEAEITEGLEPDEVVIVAPESAVSDGSRVSFL